MSDLLSHCQRYLGILLELWQGSWGASGVEVDIPASISCSDRYCSLHRFSRGVRHHVMLRHGSPLWSQVRNGVSGLISRWGGELVLSLELQQGSQTSISVVTGNSGFHSSSWHGISPYVELRGSTMSF